MRWPSFFILVYVSMAVDAGLRWPMRIGEAMPDLVLPAVLFIALAAPRNAALIGCLILGLARDLAMGTPLGMYGLSYGLVALAVTGIRDSFDPRYPIARLILALMGSLVVGLIVYIQSRIHGPSTLTFWLMLKETLYSGLVAMAGLWMLARMRRLFVVDGHRRR